MRSRVVSSPQVSFPARRHCLFGSLLVDLGRQHFRYSSPGRDLINIHNTSFISSLDKVTGGRPSLSTSGCLTHLVVDLSRSPRPPHRHPEPSVNERLKNRFTISRPQLASIALLSLQVGMHPPLLVRWFSTIKVGLSQTHSNHPHITSALPNTFTAKKNTNTNYLTHST